MADIRHALQISASPEAVYPLVATAAGLAQWWAADLTESGGKVELGFFTRATVYGLKAMVEVARVRQVSDIGDNPQGRAEACAAD